MSEVIRKTWDVIIIGGGSAGCAAARRLIDDGRLSVLLIEQGRRDKNLFIHIPATLFKVLMSSDSHVFKSEQQPQLGGRSYHIPQGKVLGGGSSVNAMCYIRGQAEDYDGWAAQGCDGWSFDDVLPVFVRHENNQRLRNDYHGNAGPLTVSDPRYRHPMTERFIQSAAMAGHEINDDFNGAEQSGLGYYQTTTRLGRRASSAQAFVKPVAASEQFDLLTDHRVNRVVMRDGVVTGVEVVNRRGEISVMGCSGEVVLSAGAIVSPTLLMRSGIGPQSELDRLGIDCVRDLAGVGQNFQDHTSALYTIELNRPVSLNGQQRGLKALRHAIEYAVTRRGLLSSNIIEAGGFVDTTGAGRPDVQFNSQAIVPGPPGARHFDVHGFGVGTYCLRPRSRGSVRLRSAKLDEGPLLNPGVLTDVGDVQTIRRGMRVIEEIFAQQPLREMTRGRLYPAPGLTTDEEFEEHVRQTGRTVFHPAGTCKMGQGEDAVVTPRLTVRGVRGLRVADASVMPNLLSGNTNAPAMMIGDRAAGFLLEDRARDLA